MFKPAHPVMARPKFGGAPVDKARDDYNRGRHDGEVACARSKATRPGDPITISVHNLGSVDYERGYRAALEACRTPSPVLDAKRSAGDAKRIAGTAGVPRGGFVRDLASHVGAVIVGAFVGGLPGAFVGAVAMPTILAAKKRFGTTKSPADKAREDYNVGLHEGAVFCERWHAAGGDSFGKPLPSRAAAAGAPDVYGHPQDLDYKAGFFAGKEACEMKYAKPIGKWSSLAYEQGRSDGSIFCRSGRSLERWMLTSDGRAAYKRYNSDGEYKRGFDDGRKENGC